MTCFLYIMANTNRTLYTGIASDLTRRIEQHRNGTYRNAFTARYNFAAGETDQRMTRAKKVALIEKQNPQWKDLAVTWRDVFK